MKKNTFIADKEMFKAVCFAEKIFAKGEKPLEDCCKIAASYYKQEASKVMEYVKDRQS